MTRSVNGRSWSGPAPGARSRSCPRRPRSRSSSAAIHGPASSPVSLPSLRRPIPVQIRCDKAVRAHPDSTSRSFRAAAHIPGIDTPQSPATPQKSYRGPSRKYFLSERTPAGAASPFAIRLSDLIIVFQTRGQDIRVTSFTGALPGILRDESGNEGWRVESDRSEISFSEWRASEVISAK